MRKNLVIAGASVVFLFVSVAAINYFSVSTYVQIFHKLSPIRITRNVFAQVQNQNYDSNYGIQSQSSSSQQELSLPELFQQARNSVVEIKSTVSNPDSLVIINGAPSEGQSTRLGSGFIYDAEGHIITNYHVVSGTQTVYVTFADGNTYAAKVIGTDQYNDIAVLNITDNFTYEKIIPLQFGNSSNLQIGQYVAAIGNPFGLTQTLTHGIISAIGRSLSDSSTGGFSIPDVIQTDAAINSGNSGGPLLDMYGHVIGMNTAIQTDSGDFSGIGFVIPSNQIARIVPILIENGTYQHPWLGVEGRNMDADLALANNLPRDYYGVMVMNVLQGSPADKAGIQAATLDENNIPHGGDIIIGVDGHKVRTIYDIIDYQDSNKSVGDKMTLEINRGGKIIDIIVTLAARPGTPTT
ncbi:MAG: trypsin-like peptidase domain-containing protein [Nitrosotalea sp.]